MDGQIRWRWVESRCEQRRVADTGRRVCTCLPAERRIRLKNDSLPVAVLLQLELWVEWVHLHLQKGRGKGGSKGAERGVEGEGRGCKA